MSQNKSPRAASPPNPALRLATATWLLLALLFLELVLMYGERQRWIGVYAAKGWIVLIGLAGVLSGLILLAIAMVIRRWLGKPIQFTLRTLLALMAVIGVGCGWLANEKRQADCQSEIVQAAERAGCGVFYDYNLDETGGVRFFTGAHPGETRLHAWLGKDFFHDVIGARATTDEGLLLLRDLCSIRRLYADNSHVTDVGMKVVASFPDLEEIDLRDASQVGDAGLKHVRNLTKLKGVLLRRTRVSDAGMHFLRDLKYLEVLDLGMTPVTGEGLKRLTPLTCMRQLSFWGNEIDDEALAAVQRMKGLEILDLGGAAVSDEGLKSLEGLSKLEVLGLRGSQITDAGIQRMTRLSNLRQLDLYNTPITDASIEHLAQFGRLQVLYLGETAASPQGVKRLQESLPRCKIEQ
jgi:hypothetical protein